MSSYRAADLLAMLQAGNGMSGGTDTLWSAFGEALSIIRDCKWHWNWTEDYATITAAPFEPTDLFTWVKGNSYLTMATGSSLPRYMTGRKVKIGDYWYRVVDIELTAVQRVYLDRPLMTTEATGTALSFVRDELALRTTSIRKVEINRQKIDKMSPNLRAEKNIGIYMERDTGRPLCYMPRDSFRLPPPAFPPAVVTGAPDANAPEAGRYYFFYTRYDAESGIESMPGPVVSYTATGTDNINITYSNPAGNKSENTSYPLRLYRSRVAPNRERVPMYVIQEREAATAATFVDNNQNLALFNKAPFWDGPYALLEFSPKPDSEQYAVSIDYLNSYYYRPDEEDSIEMGSSSAVMELARIYMAGVVSTAVRNPTEHRAAIMEFRRQLNYLISKSRNSGSDDPGSERLTPVVPGDDTQPNGDWVDRLPWAY